MRAASWLVWAAWAFILVLVIAALAAMFFSLLTAPSCTSVDAETITKETVEALRASGWYSDPADGKEQLYSPGCRTRGAAL